MISLKKREGLARICEFRGHETPMIVDFTEGRDVLNDVDFGIAPYVLKYIDEELFKVLGPKEGEIKVLTGLKVLSPRRLVEVILKERAGDFRPIYAPAAATPMNLPLLIYLGVDIVDNILPIIRGYEGIYMMESFEVRIDELKRLPCNCPVCNGRDVDEMDEELIAMHNVEILKRQLEVVKEQIRIENFRNFVEAHVKFDPELTAMLRIADESGVIVKYEARFKRSKMKPTSEDSFNRPEVVNYFERAVMAYRPKGKVLLILPCSARKPYLLSKSHRRIRGYLGDLVKGVEEIIVSSPLVVPRVFELVYPAVNYDVPVTGRWSGDEVEYVSERLMSFIEKGRFEAVIAHVTGGYRRVVETLGIDAVYTAEDDVTSEESLRRLKNELEGLEREEFSLEKSIFEHMIRYQFEIDVPLEGCEVRGRYPNLELFVKGERAARIDLVYGMLDIYRPIALELVKRRVYAVKIDNFRPKGRIYAVGVLKVYGDVRPNDLVVFYNDEIFGVGRAVMLGGEMEVADRGVAIDVKRVYELP